MSFARHYRSVVAAILVCIAAMQYGCAATGNAADGTESAESAAETMFIAALEADTETLASVSRIEYDDAYLRDVRTALTGSHQPLAVRQVEILQETESDAQQDGLRRTALYTLSSIESTGGTVPLSIESDRTYDVLVRRHGSGWYGEFVRIDFEAQPE